MLLLTIYPSILCAQLRCLVIGQSNATYNGTSDYTVDDRLKLLNTDTGEFVTWNPADFANFSHTTSTGGDDLGVSEKTPFYFYALQNFVETQDKEVELISVCKNGTPLVWFALNAGLRGLRDKHAKTGWTEPLSVIFIAQGEADTSAVDEDRWLSILFRPEGYQYVGGSAQYVPCFRNRLIAEGIADENTLWVLNTVTYDTTSTQYAQFNKMLYDFVEENPDIPISICDTNGLDTSDGVHYIPDDVDDLGLRASQALISGINQYWPPPLSASLFVTNNHEPVTVEFEGGILESSDDLIIWEEAATTSPYVEPSSSDSKYYRVRK